MFVGKVSKKQQVEHEEHGRTAGGFVSFHATQVVQSYLHIH